MINKKFAGVLGSSMPENKNNSKAHFGVITMGNIYAKQHILSLTLII